MKGPEARQSSVTYRRGPSRLVVAGILVPALSFVGYLAYWAYTVSDWTWFGLLLAAGLGLLAFAVAPELFSLSAAEESHEPSGEWRLTISAPRFPGDAAPASTTAGAAPAPVSPEPKPPNRNA